MAEKKEWEEIIKEVEELSRLHEETITSSMKCREFNSRSALLLQKLEDMECYQIADRVMDLLGSCSPKDFSHCENSQRTKGILERIRDRVKENLPQE